jgi:alpha-beta hydrolase superfamily lysophospholipase
VGRSHEREVTGIRGRLSVRQWYRGAPRYVAVLAHGYGEHAGRYEHVAQALVRHGAAVYGPDHLGHGRSDGERVVIDDFEDVVTDLREVAAEAAADHSGVPITMIGHSMGGMIAARYAQRYGSDLAALVLSGPLLGKSTAVELLLGLDEIPDLPIDPDALSRDPAVGLEYAADPLVWHGPFKAPTLRAIAACLRAINEGGRIEVPTLWLHGAEDQIVPIADTRTGIAAIRGPDFTERIYPGSRHEVFNETHQTDVIADLTTFLDRALESQS